jgi:serine/threonine-protein kinase
VAQGLQHAHQLGLVHRDIKPANLFLLHPPLPGSNGASFNGTLRRGPDPVVKVIDWGLARMLPRDGEEANHDTEAEKGLLIGTADYIAPEQAQDASIVDTRADIYSLGCTFYYLLTGRPPFPGTSLMQKLVQHQEAEPEPVQKLRPDLHDEVAAVVQRMMAKKPADRFQIPLLVVAPLRRFCPGAASANGSLIRPTASANGTVPKPATSIAVPAAGGPPNRPPSSSFNMPRPGANGHGASSHGR